MGKLYKRGETYWAYYSPAVGQYVRESLRTKDRQVARKRLRDLELHGKPEAADSPKDQGGRQSGPSIAAALTAFLAKVKNPHTHLCYEQKGRHLERIFGSGSLLSGLTTEAVSQYIDTREEEGAHSSTVYKELVCLRNMLRAVGLPADAVPAYKAGYVPRKRYLTKEAYTTLRARLPANRQAWLDLACYTGMRHSEIEAAAPDWVDWNLGVINIGGTKTEGSRRVVPLAEDERLHAALHSLPVQPWGNVIRDLTRAGHASGALAKNEGITPNDLRRTFASWLIQAGVAPFVVARLLGHKSTRMVELVYGQLGLETLRAAIGRI